MPQLFDLITDLLGLTSETWQDRLSGEIVLTSPDGDEFTALWVGDPVTVTKKLGLFEFPGIVGTKVQDLGGGGARYPLTIYFHGPDNDKEAQSFFAACEQIGPWEIIHPTEGELTLQWVSYTRHIQPVTDGNITRFEIDTIEPLPDSAVISSAELAGDIDAGALDANASAADQFNSNVLQDTFNEFQSLVGAIGQGISAVKTTLRAAERFELIPAEANAILAGITTTISSFPLDTSQLSAQVQNLVQLYSEAQDSVSGILDMYLGFNETVKEIIPNEADEEGRNVAAVQELFLSAGLVGMAKAAKVGGEKTRSESLENAETISGSFTDTTNALDSIQELYQDSPIELQYFSQSQSYSDALVLAGLAARLMIQSSFDLAIEKRFALEKERNPIEITVTEYGELGDEDSNLDLFLDSNGATGSEFFVMPAGREVVVYV
jgi:prophage DNA circulation protein